MRHIRRILTGAGVLTVAAALTTGCAAASPAHTGHSSSTSTTVKHAKTTSRVIYTKSYSGSKHTKTFTAKSKWQLAYYYNCAGKKGKFTLYLHPKGKHTVKVTSQSGLGGGGSHVYAAGHYSISATTSCKWSVKATKK